ncbi:hypothetical protein BC835DRAFT_1331003, partial [Cytidiella melzeri]
MPNPVPSACSVHVVPQNAACSTFLYTHCSSSCRSSFPTTIQWFISKRWPKIGPFRVDTISLPIIYSYTAFLPMHQASSYACV